MGQLAFLDDRRLFDGTCVRFTGVDGKTEVQCGVTTFALQCRDPDLPEHGLLPSESFLAAYDKLLTEIHQAARDKYQRGAFEPEGPIRIMIHRQDLSP